jgi:DNA-binding transcriptional LysR family regulator
MGPSLIGRPLPSSTRCRSGPRFDQHVGFGRACVPELLASADIAWGRVSLVGEPRDGMGYWLIAPLPQWRQKKVKALVEALGD